MAGINPLDIYRDRNGANGTYVHLRQQSFAEAAKGDINTQMIFNEYMNQAKKLENNAMEYFKDGITKKELDEVLEFHKEAYNTMFQDNLLEQIRQEFTSNFASYKMKGSSNKGSAEKFEDIYSYVNDAIETMYQIDEVVFKYLGTENEMSPNMGTLTSLSQTQSAKARKHFESLLQIKKMLSQEGTSMDPDKLRAKIMSHISNIKGEMMETINACAKQQALRQLNTNFVSETGVTGDLSALLSENSREIRTLSERTKKTGSTTAKSDVMTVHHQVNPETGELIQMGLVGESTKSYPIGTASKAVSTVSNTPWANLFTFSDLINTNFEYIYANSYYHEEGDFRDKSNMMNRYLAARTATYAMAGIGDLSSGLAPSLFLVGTNRAIYIPDLFRDIANKKQKELSMGVTGTGVANTRYDGDGTNIQQAYIRNKKIMHSLRNNVKFSGHW